ncbi:heme ABC transporter ATP-binding protein [Roseobacter sp. HKCCD9010]|uniref:heme ABC transporter ATP-binding protein n=1 Tax=unclassified Roseobacter TaxID=196798 RepID=UPI001491359C|nr:MULTISPECIES: heme ABC transporter ATP-binding protein [unclassified Roseobacter]MBF9052465.1 heme ABC transporter ATP-binding protein [Rhodobacterales bacterium HKCCD4356]NNV14228.1 heme ABC transporter ATP-binding protein [Roseobacter sp. HKCCD7357]NNV18657.1 heme ABC transporter ATP-binding protein [Roseobacter sp. HKCCD8768]NNV28109.1 heme ABC transporter ATP-binding protein [Roseobacter sp. HKCCD8192]NNV32391.1 heme ABC transporter ATP-binding protein [Roseobacter sp. HKCCD9061]
MFATEQIRVHLGQKPILHGIDMVAQAGEITAIVGHNGSGKTTLLRGMTQEIAFEGRVLLEGQDVTTLKGWQLATRRAVLPQASRIAFPFTVLEIVRLGLMAGRDATDPSLPSKALARVGLSGFEGRYYQELSGGEQQRAQLARVLCQVWEPVEDGVPRWLLLDEPVSSLDIGHQLEVMEIARDYARAGGGVIAVMHDLNLTSMFADHVVLLAEGRCLASGPPATVFTNQTLSTAYGCDLRVNTTPQGAATYLLPHSARRAG